MAETTEVRGCASISRKAEDRSNSEEGKTGDCDKGWQKESAPKEIHAVSNMASTRKAKIESNVIDQVLLHQNNDHQANTLKIEQVQQKMKCPEKRIIHFASDI